MRRANASIPGSSRPLRKRRARTTFVLHKPTFCSRHGDIRQSSLPLAGLHGTIPEKILCRGIRLETNGSILLFTRRLKFNF